MKTSKIILISFLSVVGLFLLSFLITVETTNYYSGTDKLETIESELSNIHVIRVHAGTTVQLKTDSIGKLQYTCEKDSVIDDPFEIIADTLILKPISSGSFRLKHKIYARNINTIINEGGSVNIDIEQNHIQIINKHQGEFQILRNSAINFVQLNSNEKSRTIVSSKQIQELDAQISSATLIVNKPINRITLKAENNADITLHKANTLAAECDSTSRYRVY